MPHTTINVHSAPDSAEAGNTQGAPLCVYFDAGRFSRVTFFCGDHTLAQKLADAINTVIAEHKAPRLVEAA